MAKKKPVIKPEPQPEPEQEEVEQEAAPVDVTALPPHHSTIPWQDKTPTQVDAEAEAAKE